MQFRLTAEESWDFARLSGDFNPLHVDPVAARRLQFGGTICHGIHQMLKALDLALNASSMLPAGIESLSTVFTASLRTDQLAEVRVISDADASRLRVVASTNGQQLFSVRLMLADAFELVTPTRDSEPELPAAPKCLSFPARDEVHAVTGSVPVQLNRPLAGKLFPALATTEQGLLLVADLLATTRIIGMEFPGLHSIYSELKLHRRHARDQAPGRESPERTTMDFVQQHCDSRFRSVRVGVVGVCLEGTLNAFFRAPPVSQVRLDELMSVVSAERFVGQRALVVGGSRGLGEMAAKILIAGGAQVTLTFAKGKADAELLQQEAAMLGRNVQILQLDVNVRPPDPVRARLAGAGFTHLYYFATPQIAKCPDGSWSRGLFDDFCKFYVHAFVDLVRIISLRDLKSSPLAVLYPSTVFLDEPPKGFAEYCAAKAAGESVCECFAKEHHIQIAKPRLPRLQTDQNNGFLGAVGEAPMPLLLTLLQTLHPA